MRPSELSVSRPITTLMVFMALVAMGLVAYFRLPIQLLPHIDFPTIVVVARNDRSVEDNLDRLTRPLEGEIAMMPNVRRIRSTTAEGSVRIRIDFDVGVDLQFATVDLQDRLDRVRRDQNDRRLFLTAFPFSTSDFQASYMFLSVRSEAGQLEAFEALAENVEMQLSSISGVASVSLRGLSREVIEVELSTERLSGYGLDLPTVIGRVQAATSDNNFLGRMQTPQETHFVRLNDRVRTLDELAAVTVDSQGIVTLADVAELYQGPAVGQLVSRSDGKDSISIQMEREAGRNMIELARATRARIAEINATLPEGTELVIEEDLASYVETAIATVARLALQGALLALLIPLIFLRSLRLALVIFASVPISLIAVFNLFYGANMSINIFSIVGLALGVGMLVDSSIVVTENAVRLYEKGASPEAAAREGGGQVGRGLIAATLTSAVVFLPLVFLDGEFTVIVREPTLALVFPLLLSLLVALTLVPVLVSIILRWKKRPAEAARKRRPAPLRAYASVLGWSLRHRASLLLIIFAALAFTWLESCDRLRESTTSQEPNREWLTIFFQSFRGATLSDVNQSVRQLEARLAENPNIDRFYVSFNREGGDSTFRFVPQAERERRESFRQLQATIIETIGEIPGLTFSLQRFDQPELDVPLNLGAEGIVELKGLDRDILEAFAIRFAETLQLHPRIVDARLRETRQDPLLLAVVDRMRTGALDLRAETIARYIGATASGGTISSLQLIDGDRRTDVAFLVPEATEGTVEGVGNLLLQSPVAGSVSLAEVVRFDPSSAPTQLRRVDRQASLDLSYFVEREESASGLRDEVRRVFNSLPNPSGVTLEFQGEAQRLDDRQGQFIFVIIAGALFVYIVMAAVFESFWVPFVILLTNPLMLIGIVWGLDLTGLPLDDLAAFGVILLVGLAVNNGIVLMDRALEMQRRGVRRTRAVYEACQTRFRPIVMTYLTTVLGLLPLALVGTETDQWRPVAVVIIGGLTSATLLTLVVLPCFYVIGDDVVRWLSPPLGQFAGRCFLLIESIANGLLHPIQTLRGVKTWPRVLLRTIRWSIISLYIMAKDFITFVYTIPRDLWLSLTPPRISDRASGSTAPIEVPRFEARNLNVSVGIGIGRPERLILRGIHLELEPGLVGLLGVNGAGKTTLLRVMAGVLHPSRGQILLDGKPILGRSAERLLIDTMPQTKGVDEELTLRQWLESVVLMRLLAAQRIDEHECSAALRFYRQRILSLGDRTERAAHLEQAATEVGLSAVLDDRLATYSGGMRQRAALARLLVGEAPILLVDEPTASLDPEERLRVRVLLSRLALQRIVVVSTHLVADLEGLCNQLLVMHDGKLVYTGKPEDALKLLRGRLFRVRTSDSSGITLAEETENGIVFRRVYIEDMPTGSEALTPTLEDVFLYLVAQNANPPRSTTGNSPTKS